MKPKPGRPLLQLWQLEMLLLRSGEPGQQWQLSCLPQERPEQRRSVRWSLDHGDRTVAGQWRSRFSKENYWRNKSGRTPLDCFLTRSWQSTSKQSKMRGFLTPEVTQAVQAPPLLKSTKDLCKSALLSHGRLLNQARFQAPLYTETSCKKIDVADVRFRTTCL